MMCRLGASMNGAKDSKTKNLIGGGGVSHI